MGTILEIEEGRWGIPRVTSCDENCNSLSWSSDTSTIFIWDGKRYVNIENPLVIIEEAAVHGRHKDDEREK